MSVEHERNRAFWGEEHALRILSRMLELHADAKQTSPIPDTLAPAESRSQVDSATASQMSQMSTRLFNNQYFKSIGALFALATYRFSAFVEWLPYLSVFVLAAFLDGFIRRIVKSKEFLQHNPELFALHASLVILIICGTVVAFVLPVTVHPLLLALVPAASVSSAVSPSPTIIIVASCFPRTYFGSVSKSLSALSYQQTSCVLCPPKLAAVEYRLLPVSQL